MATWFAQNSSVNIDSANQWNSAANGSGSFLTWASLGASDVLVANGKTAIAINVDFTCATITNAATGGTAGGQFTVTSPTSGDRTITCSIVGQDSGTATSGGCVAATLHATGRFVVNGNVTAGGVSSAYGISTLTAAGILVINGDITGGSASNCFGINAGASLVLSVSGTLTGGSSIYAYGVNGGAVAIYGTYNNVTAATARAHNDGSSSSTVAVSGTITQASSVASVGNPAISTLGIVTLGASTNLTSNGTSWTFPIWGRIKWETTDTGKTITLYDAGGAAHVLKVPGYPAVGDVQSSVAFDYTTQTGTLTLPTIAQVQSGVSYGAGGTEFTGTLIEGIPTGDIVAAQYVLTGHDNYTGGSAGSLTLPAVGDVQDGVTYGVAGTGSEGTFAVPAEADVAETVQFGAGGTEFTGTLVSGGDWTATEKAQIRYRLGIDGTENTPTNTPELGSIGSDWTDTEKSHIRYRLGIDGTEAAPTNTPTLGTVAANVTQWNGSNVATPTVAGVPEVDVTHWLGTASATPSVAGVPEVDITHVNGLAASGVSTMDANVVAISGDTTAADNLEAACDGTGYNVGAGNIVAASVTGATGSVTGAVGSVTGAVGSIGAGGITSSSFAPGAITSSAMADNSIDSKVIAADAINAASLKADALTAIGAAVADAVWDESSSAHQSLGSFGLQAHDTNTQANALIEDVNITGVVVASASKTGYKLASDGLDSISVTKPTGRAATFREMIVQTWMKWFNKATLSATELKTYADDGSTVVTTQAVSDVAGTETQGPAT